MEKNKLIVFTADSIEEGYKHAKDKAISLRCGYFGFDDGYKESDEMNLINSFDVAADSAINLIDELETDCILYCSPKMHNEFYSVLGSLQERCGERIDLIVQSISQNLKIAGDKLFFVY